MNEETIEQEIPEIDTQETEPVLEPSLRDQLSSALSDAKESQSAKEESEVKTGREADGKRDKLRDNEGKFAKTQKKAQQNVEITASAPEAQDVPIPKGFSKSVETAWKDLPAPIKQELHKRDQDYHRELTKHDEERHIGRQFREIVNPYMAIIRSEGGNPFGAVKDLMNTAYLLRTESPQRKGQLLWDVAKKFGADMSQAQQTQEKVHPVLQQLQSKVEQLQGSLNQQTALKEQQDQQAINDHIKSFAGTPGHEHFEEVRAYMAALLEKGLAKDLQDAYDQAIYARPDIRSTILSQKNYSGLEEKRVAQKAKAEAARKAGSSIKGKPGMAIPQNQNSGGSLREQLRAGLHEAREA